MRADLHDDRKRISGQQKIKKLKNRTLCPLTAVSLNSYAPLSSAIHFHRNTVATEYEVEQHRDEVIAVGCLQF